MDAKQFVFERNMDISSVVLPRYIQSYYEAKQIQKVSDALYPGVQFKYGFPSDIANTDIDLEHLLNSPAEKQLADNAPFDKESIWQLINHAIENLHSGLQL
jgi:hypothetical protein